MTHFKTDLMTLLCLRANLMYTAAVFIWISSYYVLHCNTYEQFSTAILYVTLYEQFSTAILYVTLLSFEVVVPMD
jgi:hypothetical protein